MSETVYRSLNVQINSDHPLYEWCDTISHLANNLYNATLFRERQLMSSSRKPEEEWTENEREVHREVKLAIEKTDGKYKVSESGFVSNYFMTDILKHNNNPDYKNMTLPRHTANYVLKAVVQDMKSFFNATASYKVNPSSFTGRPKLPHYKRKGGKCTFTISNQECVIKTNKKGHYQAKLPHTKLKLSLGKKIPGKLKTVKVTPRNGLYEFSFNFEVEADTTPMTEKPERICAIDPGVNNLMAVTNNCGLPCRIYNGRPLKSINRYYNKTIARIMSETTKGETKKFEPTKRYMRITQKRNNRIKDYMLKTAKIFITWCVENRIDTIVIGSTAGWKQNVDMKKEATQKFVQIPHDMLKNIIEYKGKEYGIRVIRQEESYTSQASYLDNDDIPVYGNEGGIVPHFSGKRVKRGLYRSESGEKINADLNGSANILRKCLDHAFESGVTPDFRNIQIIKHPDYM